MSASTGAVERGSVSRSPAVDAMLLGTVVLWALNVTVTRALIIAGIVLERVWHQSTAGAISALD